MNLVVPLPPPSERHEPMVSCRSNSQMALFGPIPPRTPGRSDAQVPIDARLGDCRYARVPYVYFYCEGAAADVAFGLLDIEICVQRRASNQYVLEAYAIGDGYHSGRGSSAGSALQIELLSQAGVVTTTAWSYPDVLSGHMDPLTFSHPIELRDDQFKSLYAVCLPSVAGEVTICL